MQVGTRDRVPSVRRKYKRLYTVRVDLAKTHVDFGIG